MAPSTTVEKQKRREEREAREHSAEAGRRRSQRLKLLGLAVGIAAVLVCALVLISRSGGDKPQPAQGGGSKPAKVGSLAGIPQQGNVLGNPKAPVTLVEFADLQCPYCGYVATKGALPTVIDKYVRTGKVKLRMDLLGFLGPQSRKAALVAAAASQQNKMFQFSDAFFAKQKEENTGYVTDAFLGSIASKAGLDSSKLLAQAKRTKAEGLVNGWSSEGHTANITGTPSFFVQKGDGGVAAQIQVKLDDVSTFSGPLDDALRG